ncbi:immunoglobulin-like and fibronectin type III domain-containing protein 1 [Rhea pennata]|uniref:immunoglobulin-like and fibronectin type III domain-containing protein 1 n=1 Tax=Rhea pennata TaxID=8795 RepID=UPI002E252DE8
MTVFAKTFKKSSILGVTITQFADDIPEGCSTPDFERKPVSQTLLEGKNAIFRAVVKGVPTPDVNWKRTKGEMDDSTKYKTSFNAITNEFVLQINKLTADDTDLYRCSAVNEYGEAACTAGLRIIEAGFKRKAKYVPIHPADELKKKLQDFRKMLRKRPPKPPPKPVDMEAIWQLLLHANRRDYERICMKYGISDFRGMLRKLQEMRKDTETKYGELLNSIKNQQHIRVNRKGQATFSLEMDLKNSKSKICLFKDGERVRYGTENEYRKYFLRQVGKRYNFVVNDVQPEDAGLYQVRVEDVPVFSTELEAESIPVRFKHPLRNVCCLEGETAVFECTLCTPCYDVVWLHKTHLLEASEKHQISVTPDGLTHQLIIKDVLPSDGGMYVVDTGLCFSNARLIVEYAKGKRRQNEDERDKAGWLEGQLSDKDRVKKLRQGEYLDDQDHFMDISMEEDGLYRNGQEGSQGYSSDVDGRRRFLGQEGLDEAHGNGRIRFGQFSRAEIDEDSMTSDGSSSRLTGLSGLGSSHGKDSMTGRAHIDGKDGMPTIAGINGESINRGEIGKPYGKDDLTVEGSGPAGQQGRPGLLYGPSGLPTGDGAVPGVGGTSVGGMGTLYGPDGLPAGAGVGGADVAGKEGMGYPYGKDKFPMGMGAGRGRGLGIVESPYGKGGLPAGTVDSDLGGVGSPYEKDGLPVGMGAGTGSIGSPYGKDGIPAGTSVGSLGDVSSPYGKDGLQNGVGVGGPGVAGARAFDSPYGKDSLPAGAGGGDLGGIGSPYGKDGLHVGMGAQAGVGGLGVVGSPYGKDGLPAGTGVDGGGAASLGGVGSPYGKDGLLAGAGVGVGSVAGLGGVGSPYGKDGLPAGTGVGSVAGLGGVGSPYGKDGLPAGSGVGSVAGLGGVGFPYGKDGLAAGTGVGSVAGLGGVGSPYGKDGLPAGTGVGSVAGLGGVGSPYGKDGLAAGTGVGSVAGLGGVGSPYGKDGLPAGTGVDGVAGLGGVGSPYGKDGLAAGTGVGSVAGLGGVGSPYGKDGLPAGTGVDGAGSAAGLGGVGSPYGKDGHPAGTGVGAGSVAGLGGVGSPYGKDGLPAGAGVGGVAGLGGVGSPCGKDGLPAEAVGGGAGVAGAGGFGSFYGKDGLPAGAGVDHGGVGGLGGVGSPYGKDGLPAGTGGSAGVAGAGGFVTDSPYGKDGLPSGAGVDGTRVSGVGGFGPPCGKDGLPAGAAAGGGGVLGGVVSPYRKDGLPAGAGIGSSGVGAIDSLYGKDGLPVGNAAGTFPSGATVAGAGDVESSYGKGGLPAGAGVDGAAVADAGGFGSPYRKDSHPAGDVVGSLGGVGSPYRKDGLSAGAGVDGGGAASLGGVGSPYGKDGIPVGAGAGAGVVAGVGLGGVGTPYGKDGLPSGAGVDGGSAAGLGGVGSPYGKDGSPVGVGAGAGVVAGVDLGGVGTPYGKDGLPSGAGVDGGSAASLGGVGSPYGKDGIPVGAGAGAGVVAGVGLGGVGTPYGKDGLPSGAGVDGGSAAGLGGVGSPYGKDGVPVGVGAGAGVVAGVGLGGVGSPYGKDGLPSGAGVDGGGAASLGIVGSPYGKDGLPAGASVGGGGAASLGGVGTPYGKDGLPAGASVGNLGGVGSPYAKDGLPAGDGVGVFGDGLPPGANIASLGGVGSPYGKDGLPAGTGVDGGGVGGLGGVGSPYGKVGLPSWAGVDGGGAASSGGVGSPYGKDGLPVGAGAGVVVGGGVGSPYGKDGLPAGTGGGGAAAASLGGVGSPYGKDDLPAGTGVVGGAAASVGGVGSPYGKDGLPAGTGVDGGGVGGVGSPYGKDGLPVGMTDRTAAVGGSGARGFGSSSGNVDLSARDVAGAAHFPFRGEEGRGSYNKDVMLSRTQGYLDGGGAAFRHGRSSSEGRSVGGASAIQAVESSYGKDGVSAGSRAAAGGVGRLGSDERELHSVHGRAGAVGLGGEFGLDSHPGKFSMRGEAGTSAHIDFRGSGHRGSTDDRDSLSGQGSARSEDRDLGQLGSYYSKDSAFGGAGSKSHNRYADGRKSGVLHEGSLAYDQLSDPDGGLSSINQRKQIPGLDIKAKEYLKSTDSMERKRFHKDDLKAPRGRVTKPLVDVRVLKGEPAELSCAVSNDEVKGTWFKDGLKLKSMDGVLFVEEGSVHKLIINKVEDIHAGKYKFEAADMKTEASLFVEDPPHVDKVLLKNLMNVPIEAKAGQKIKIKIPFEGQLPIRATWLKDRMELVDDRRIRVDETDTFTMLTISSSERKDSGDYKVRLKNDHGVLEINLKIVVIDKPQQPTGPIEVLESSASGITIQWKPPKEDGGKPVQSYIVERKQIGQEDWVTLGETLKGCTTFTTNKVEQDTSYYFRVRAVNAEGTSDALKSDQVKAVGKGSPGPPDPPEIVSASKETITISWKTPHKTGNSRIVGYMVQKRKKGANIWMPVTKVPVADKVLKITNLKMGLQYEFRVAAVNAAGVGEASAPSEPVFAQDSTKPPGQVRDLRVASSDSTSITLTWRKPEPKEGVDVKGYEVEMRSYDNLNWTKCSALPINETTYTVKGLQTKELYFLRVRALNDSGPGEAAELEASTEAAPPVVPPRFLIDDRVKSFLIIKAGNTIRVPIPFEASPDPVVTWLKDGLPLPRRATINTEYGTTQLLIEAAEFSDSGTYTVVLQNGSGNKEVFSFQVQVTDIPQSPGPIELEETVPNAVTVTWEPSASEKWESNLYYTVLKRESQKGLWHMVGDLIYTNKFTFTKLIPGRDYYFRVVAKNYLGASAPSETIKPWRLRKEKAKFEVKQPEYREVNQNETPRFLVQLKPHVVTTGTECHMSCAVAGHPPPKITWYKDGRDLSKDSTYLCTNTFGVCSLVILSAAKSDEGEYMVQATNELGRAFSKTFLTIKGNNL